MGPQQFMLLSLCLMLLNAVDTVKIFLPDFTDHFMSYL